MRVSERIARETARDYAIRVIHDNIISMTLEPGCMVSENELATEMGVSRTPVREALIELSKTGLVEIFPQHGSMVSKIDYAKVEEASFMRRVLETAVVEEACVMATPADIRELEDNLAIQDLYLAKGDKDKLLALDNQFHRDLFRICRKTLCYQLMQGLIGHFDRVRHMFLATARDPKIVEDHHDILAAIVDRDRERARETMNRHLKRHHIDKGAIREKYARYFSDGG